MEADWEIEVGPGAPVIDALWTGFVHLRDTPAAVASLEEVQRLPALGTALLQLNHPPAAEAAQHLWTAKCDVWNPNDLPDTIPPDPDELDATPEETCSLLACYLDLLPHPQRVFASLAEAESWARDLVRLLHSVPLRCCRADLVIRGAVAGEAAGFATTAYLTGCGADPSAAAISLSSALSQFTVAANSLPSRQRSRKTLQ
jgi:hypothetical protein